jgi:hypothetical protein
MVIGIGNIGSSQPLQAALALNAAIRLRPFG